MPRPESVPPPIGGGSGAPSEPAPEQAALEPAPAPVEPAPPTAEVAPAAEPVPPAALPRPAEPLPAPPAAPPAEPPPAPPPPPPPPPPGLREQLARTIGAGRRLADAHLSLAKLELDAIIGEAKGTAALAGVAIAFLIFAAMLLAIGGTLFVGEWLFGSIGWGVLHGLLFSIAIAVALALGALKVPLGHLVRTFIVALGLGIIVGSILGFGWANTGWSRLGDAILPGVEAANHPLLTAVLVVGAVLALLGFLAGARAAAPGERVMGAVFGLLGGALAGALCGAISSAWYPLHVGVAIGVVVTLVAWPALAATALRGFDWDAFKARFTPTMTMETAQETLEWIRERTPAGKRS